MNDSRIFKRVYCDMDGQLINAELTYNCRLMNISSTGVLVGVKEPFVKIVSKGDLFTLSVYSHTRRQSIKITTKVVHHGFSMLGLEFIKPDAATLKILAEITFEQSLSCNTRNLLYA